MTQQQSRAAREQAFALLFEMEFHADLQAVLAARDEDAESLHELALQFATLAVENLPALDEEIAKRLKPGWRLGRIPRATRALLRLALCEMLHMDDIPVGVSINEAVELAKLYGDEDAPKFVNGLLGAIARSSEQEPSSEAE
ncbi:MAG: transcription antitermination factor NusB [Oscillospiraceae bacterium]|nr:transcription antitermination factor NusB [Oscillospiraceae bacterium]